MKEPLILIVCILLYLAPAIIARLRGHLNVISIFALNLLLGWLVIGWIIALIWALTSNTKADQARKKEQEQEAWRRMIAQGEYKETEVTFNG